jgi:hypothetical protein
MQLKIMFTVVKLRLLIGDCFDSFVEMGRFKDYALMSDS